MHNVTQSILTPDTGKAYLHLLSVNAQGEQVYEIAVQIDNDPTLHEWLLRERWNRAGSATARIINCQRPSRELRELLKIAEGVPRNLAQVVAGLGYAGQPGDPIVRVRVTQGDYRLASLHVIREGAAPVDVPGLETPVIPRLDSPELASALAAAKERAAAAAHAAKQEAMRLFFEKCSRDDRMKAEKDEAKAYAKRVKVEATRTAKQFRQQRIDIANIKAMRWESLCAKKGHVWATRGASYYNFRTPHRSAEDFKAYKIKYDEERGLDERDPLAYSTQIEDEECQAPCRARQEKERWAYEHYVKLRDSWKPENVHWSCIDDKDLEFYNNELDIVIEATKSHTPLASVTDITETYWAHPERRHIEVDWSYYEMRGIPKPMQIEPE